MKHWQQHSKSERLDLLELASAKKGLPLLAIEKDWWVTMVLKALSLTQYASLMSFKGGTSLSKGWNLIERFSEDIDMAICREGKFAISGTSNTQLAKARRTARHYIVRELPTELEEALHRLGVEDFVVEPEMSRERDGVPYELRADTHPSAVYVHFNSIVPDVSEYLLPKVKIEISCLSMDEPVEEKTITSFISEVIPEAEDVEVPFKTVLPSRTFLEKIFLLHEEFQKEHPRHNRMSRHLYDLEKLMDTPFGKSALSDIKLYNDIVQHRSTFNHIPYVDYKTHSPATIDFIPPAEVMEEWENDYNSLGDNLLYFRERKITFAEMMERMRELQRRIRHSESLK